MSSARPAGERGQGEGKRAHEHRRVVLQAELVARRSACPHADPR
ncbi:hypothetical protein ABZ299_20990 [Streptomyces sp. NPDC006184]